MFLVKFMICFYILIILGSIICNIFFNVLEGADETLDPLTQAKLNQAEILKVEKQVNDWNIEQINNDINSLNEKCEDAVKAHDELKQTNENM